MKFSDSRFGLLTLAAAFLVGSAVTGCGGPSKYKPTVVPPPAPVSMEEFSATSMIPGKAGSSWTYDFESITQTRAGSNSEQGKMRFTIDAVKDNPKGQILQMSISKNGETMDRQNWQVSDRGLYQLTAGINSSPFTPIQPLLMLPIKDNMKFMWKGKGICPDGNPGTMRVDSEVRGVEMIDTATGKESALAVETNTQFKSTKMKALLAVTTWYKPNVGIVRLKQALQAPGGAVVTTLKLASGPK
jgi:hypothetical protein